MQDYRKEIQEYAVFIWNSQFAMSVTLGEEKPPQNSKDLAEGIVQITGNSVGSIVLKMESDLVDIVTEKMFAIEPGQATQDEKRDAVSELTNMIGGNIKSLVAQPSNLSIPVVILDGNTTEFPNSKTITDVAFECVGGKFWLSIQVPQDTTEAQKNSPVSA